MPIYEYRCQSCGHELEKLQKISDPPLADCPECGEPALTKLISAAGFRLKGGGWYETDFKKGDKRNLAGDAKDKKSDAKPDSKGDGKSSSSGSEKGGDKSGSSTASTGQAA
ncbi:zinc ribbon domain-containing protein [Wenzhouxiangella sp. XN201]|uniref:FmdB family zinc ribbon protein n=1 Tax=Wenzhouxiangella sp. XN201 TaxID=2710755 RepID=UPI0013CD9B84|nr:zinc ribbon domain-containing protein [Wenzhouxiangella sp. XN201]NEZ04596.1 zinc ribbon domain-containing protein [Wenzhouxiangella sp. XN201]